MNSRPSRLEAFRRRIGNIIFETDTPAARLFDVLLLWAILLSVLLVMLESVATIEERYGAWLRVLEWSFTGLFTAEYLLRIFVAFDRRRYILSFYGIVDLLAILPSYLGLVLGGSQYFIVIRALRLLRVFRVLKLIRFLGEASTLARALRASREKIIVFLVAVLILVTILGSLMFLVEGEEGGFYNIPVSVYWAIVTLTTVGYGDVAPVTPLGRFLASIVMILGYGIIAVPTGIVTTELSRASRTPLEPPFEQPTPIVQAPAQPPAPSSVCLRCGATAHDADARYCKHCGERLTAS